MNRNPKIQTLYRVSILFLAIGVISLAAYTRNLKQRANAFEQDLENAGDYDAAQMKTKIEGILRQHGLEVDEDTVEIENDPRCELYFYLDELSDISFLKKLPPFVRLVSLRLGKTQIQDIDALRSKYEDDLCLRSLDVVGTSISDLDPLVGHPIRWLDVSSTKVTNLAPLKDTLLTSLRANFTDINDLSALKGMHLTELEMSRTPLSDLAPLEGMPLELLAIQGTPVSDLAPLRGMPLENLYIDMTLVADLSPIKGMKISGLGLGYTKVTSLDAVRGMPLKGLSILGTDITDLTPLADMNLSMLAFEPWRIEKGMEVVRAMPTLEIINVGLGHEYTYLNPAAFWQRYDAGEFEKGKQKWKTREELMEMLLRAFDAKK